MARRPLAPPWAVPDELVRAVTGGASAKRGFCEAWLLRSGEVWPFALVVQCGRQDSSPFLVCAGQDPFAEGPLCRKGQASSARTLLSHLQRCLERSCRKVFGVNPGEAMWPIVAQLGFQTSSCNVSPFAQKEPCCGAATPSQPVAVRSSPQQSVPCRVPSRSVALRRAPSPKQSWFAERGRVPWKAVDGRREEMGASGGTVNARWGNRVCGPWKKTTVSVSCSC